MKKFEKPATEVTRLDTQIRRIFKDYELTLLKVNNHFVEFNYQNLKDPRAGNEIDFSILQSLHKLLKPKKMQINGWTVNGGCEKCNEEEHFGYVVAYLK